MTCSICLNLSNDAIELYHEIGKLDCFADLMHLHLQIHPTTLDFVCQECWLKLNSFHDFYCEVKEKHIQPEIVDTGNLKLENHIFKIEQNKVKDQVKIEHLLSEYNSSDDSTEHHPVVFVSNCENMAITERPAQVKVRKVKSKKLKPLTDDPDLENGKIYGGFPEKLIQGFCELKCDHCNYSYKKWSEMTRHYEKDHQMEGYVNCCQKKYTKRSSFLQHLDKHIPEADRKHKCEICQKSFVKKFALDSHKRSHMNKQDYAFTCNDCGKLFATKYSLTIHINGVHKGAYTRVCEICAKVFKNNMIYLSHQRVFHTDQQPAKIQCQKCGNW